MSDSCVLCTGLLADVFQLHVSEMAAEGKIADMFDAFVKESGLLDPRGFECENAGEVEEVT
eukprot:1403541-Rhodomonas_salina.1